MSENPSKNDNDNDINEDELGSLLNNTFNDFCKIYNKNESSNKNDMNFCDENLSEQTHSIDGSNVNDSETTSPFLSLYGSDDELKENWSKLAKSCNQPVDKDLHESLLSSLKVISEKAQSISKDQSIFSDDEMAKIMTNLAVSSSGETGDNDENIKDNMFELNKIMPLMSNIMENLLSKDFLYPTLSELKSKYPAYLAENQSTLSKDDYCRYESQLKIIRKICEEFENDDNDKETNNDEMKSIRFNRILSLMQTMQSFGTPPSALVSGNTDMMFNDHLNAMNNPDYGQQQQQQQQQCNIIKNSNKMNRTSNSNMIVKFKNRRQFNQFRSFHRSSIRHDLSSTNQTRRTEHPIPSFRTSIRYSKRQQMSKFVS
ncbi:Peroxisome chaperone and import receptor [Dermatophagoides pteronyssinus]|uniref:Peroxin-19 n=1 Tax=Dermatophagoides pteronyssinus TaxID=6956 RepID=A0ABQ8JN11_DERPT|nr:Peroxisome chaperone and import receptor [Dermatophagoides pteronyssinus]